MVDCPRCGDTVEELRSLPADRLSAGVVERRERGTDDRSGRACAWCRHEVIEG